MHSLSRPRQAFSSIHQNPLNSVLHESLLQGRRSVDMSTPEDEERSILTSRDRVFTFTQSFSDVNSCLAFTALLLSQAPNKVSLKLNLQQVPTFIEPTPMTFQSDLLLLEMQLPSDLEYYRVDSHLILEPHLGKVAAKLQCIEQEALERINFMELPPSKNVMGLTRQLPPKRFLVTDSEPEEQSLGLHGTYESSLTTMPVPVTPQQKRNPSTHDMIQELCQKRQIQHNKSQKALNPSSTTASSSAYLNSHKYQWKALPKAKPVPIPERKTKPDSRSLSKGDSSILAPRFTDDESSIVNHKRPLSPTFEIKRKPQPNIIRIDPAKPKKPSSPLLVNTQKPKPKPKPKPQEKEKPRNKWDSPRQHEPENTEQPLQIKLDIKHFMNQRNGPQKARNDNRQAPSPENPDVTYINLNLYRKV